MSLDLKATFKKTESEYYYAEIVLGAEYGYKKKSYSKDELIVVLQSYQNQLIHSKGIHLGVNLSDSCIVLSGQVEPHFVLRFIMSPLFPIEKLVFVAEVELLCEHLMILFEQNRTMIFFPDKLVMLEGSKLIDPGIQKFTKE